MYSGGTWNDISCSSAKPFLCEIDACGSNARSSESISLHEGEIRYFEVIGFSNEGASEILVTLDMATSKGQSWSTSEALGLSAEFFNEISEDESFTPVHVSVNALHAACQGGTASKSCGYHYSKTLTPFVTSITPREAKVGTQLTITGAGFSTSAHPNR